MSPRNGTSPEQSSRASTDFLGAETREILVPESMRFFDALGVMTSRNGDEPLTVTSFASGLTLSTTVEPVSGNSSGTSTSPPAHLPLGAMNGPSPIRKADRKASNNPTLKKVPRLEANGSLGAAPTLVPTHSLDLGGIAQDGGPERSPTYKLRMDPEEAQRLVDDPITGDEAWGGNPNGPAFNGALNCLFDDTENGALSRLLDDTDSD